MKGCATCEERKPKSDESCTLRLDSGDLFACRNKVDLKFSHVLVI